MSRKNPQTGRPKRPKRTGMREIWNSGCGAFITGTFMPPTRPAASMPRKAWGIIDSRKKYDRTPRYYAVDLASGQCIAPMFRSWKSAADYVEKEWNVIQKAKTGLKYQTICAKFKLEIAQSMLMEREILSAIDARRKKA